MCGNSHYRARAVRCENVVAYINGEFCAIYGVDGVSAGECTRLFFVKLRSFHFRLARAGLFVSFNFFALFGYCNFVHKCVFGRENAVGSAVKSIATGGENGKLFICAVNFKVNVRAHRFAYPVSLSRF